MKRQNASYTYGEKNIITKKITPKKNLFINTDSGKIKELSAGKTYDAILINPPMTGIFLGNIKPFCYQIINDLGVTRCYHELNTFMKVEDFDFSSQLDTNFTL